jgi:hypothetical protein
MPMISDDEPETAGAERGTHVSTVVVVDTSDARPNVQRPPALGWDLGLLPMLTLPGNIRIVMDGKNTHADAARWWVELSIAAMYLGIWHDLRVAGRSVLGDVDPSAFPNPFA